MFLPWNSPERPRPLCALRAEDTSSSLSSSPSARLGYLLSWLTTFLRLVPTRLTARLTALLLLPVFFAS